MVFSVLSRAWPSTRRGRAMAVCGLGGAVAVGLALGLLVAAHLSPCNPRNLDRCGRRLTATLRGLDAASDSPAEDASALCPSLAEAVDCYFWFSQRCLPLREHLFYSKVYVEASGVVQGLCRGDTTTPLLVTHAACLRTARTRRAECTGLFADPLGDSPADDAAPTTPALAADALIDSLYDVEGVFQYPLCRALGQFILCGLQLVSDTCGTSLALRVQDLHDNLTDLVFSSKCDPELRPVLPGPVAALEAVDLMAVTPGTYTLLSLVALLLPVCIVLVYRLVPCKKIKEKFS